MAAEADSGWALLGLDEKMAKRHGMPQRIPVPKSDYPSLAEKGLSHDRTRAWIAKFLAEAGRSLRQSDPKLAAKYDAYLAKIAPWDAAQKAFSKHDYVRAISSLSLVARLDSEDYAAKQSLATTYAVAGESEKALQLFAEIAEVWAGSDEFHVAFANVLMRLGRKDDAIEQFVLALEAQPECHGAMEGLVSLGVLVKIYEDPLDAGSSIFVRKDSVLQYLKSQWEATNPSYAALVNQIGYHEDAGRFEVMLEAAERALSCEGANRQLASLAKTRALRLMGKLEEATASVSALLEQMGESAGALVEWARCLATAGKHDAALDAVDRALALEPGHLGALGLKYLPSETTDLQAVAKALPALETWAGTHPTSAGAWRVLGRAQVRAGNSAVGLQTLERAVSLAPDNDDQRSEYWSALVREGASERVLHEAQALGNLTQRDWRLRWTEAEALTAVGKRAEARTAYTLLNGDQSLHVAIRARAKRAVEALSS